MTLMAAVYGVHVSTATTTIRLPELLPHGAHVGAGHAGGASGASASERASKVRRATDGPARVASAPAGGAPLPRMASKNSLLGSTTITSLLLRKLAR